MNASRAAYPDHDAGQEKTGLVALAELVGAGGDAAPLLELADAALDGIPVFIDFGLVADRSATRGAFALAVGRLVGFLRDDRLDPAQAQIRPVLPGGVRLVRHHCARSAPGRAAPPVSHPELV